MLAPSIAVTKAADRPIVSTTEQMGFQVGVSNGGPGTAFAVTLSDPLPAGNGVTWSISPAYAGPGTCDINGSAPNQVLACSIGTMASGDSTTVHIVSDTTRQSAGQYDNTATANAAISLSASASASITVQAPQLSIVKTADAPEVRAGQQIGFTMTVANAGPGSALNATLTDPLPGQSTIDWSVDNYTGPGSCVVTGAAPAQTLECAFGDLAAGDSVSVHVISQTGHLCEGTYENTATAAAQNDGPLDASASLTVLPDGLVLQQTADAPTAATGDTIGFTIALHNNGPDTSFKTVLNDALPGGSGVTWSIDPAYAGPGTCAINGSAPNQSLACSLGDLANGSDVSLHLSSPTDDGSIGTYTSDAKARAQNNTIVDAAASVIVHGVPKLFIAKSECLPQVAPGSTVTYDLGFGNTGNGPATGAVLRATLPDGVTITDAGGGSVNGQVVTWQLGTLDPGETGARAV